jgi:hypothetical protein
MKTQKRGSININLNYDTSPLINSKIPPNNTGTI